MPHQRVIFGLPMPRIAPRRISFLLVSLGLFALFTLLFTLPSAIPTGPSLSKSIADHKFSIPKYKDKFSTSILNPLRPASHKPAEQQNSVYGGSSWYSNWNWLSPFSSSITLDENRSLLPPLKERAAIYCYYDTTIERDDATKEAESALLLTWRRAWWAQGFKPIILSAAEAMNNPYYDELQRLEVEPGFKKDMMRWLAWENMGGGLLSHQLLFPMGAYQDPLLSYLRRGEYPALLTRWEGFDDGLFAGTKSAIAAAITQALRKPQEKSAKDLVAAVTSDTFHVDPSHDSLAFYNAKTIEKSYDKIAEEVGADRAQGLKSLNVLINFHLHNTWQDMFKYGIAVLKPMPDHTTHMIEPAFDLAARLATCSNSPLPSSCPPNIPRCSPCVSSHPMKVATPARYRNTTGLFTIGTVAHPYTLRSLSSLRETIDVAWVRRNTKRDEWLYLVFQELLGTGISGSARVVKFKEAVAGEFATSHSLWLTAEKESLPHDLDWWFGFELPPKGADDGKSETPVPGKERRPKPEHDPADGPVSTEDDLTREPRLLERAREVSKSKAEQDVRAREAIEAWNLADTEAWRFAKAFLARSRVERLKWEEEESKYAGGVGSDTSRGRRNSWVRWGDHEEKE
ncbi:hypothetical protein F5B20DRAFT_525386 [Whalleya microplaca]|nr:hypothetical protein F5B20DRAFT_525386 [Whalleya microplaca]